MSTDSHHVTVVIPTLNEADRLPACLASVQWAAQIIVADAGSTDGTIAIARQFGAIVLENTGPTIGAQRNAAIGAASQPWILAVDADERVTAELRDSIAAAIRTPAADAFRVHMRNRYLGAPMERGGWGRDRHVRLFRATLRYSVQRVHEGLEHDGPIVDLQGRIDHDSYRDLAHQLKKVTTYSTWGAADLHARGKRVGISHLVVRPAWRFVKCYFLQGAWREGRRGIVLSAVHAWSAFAKYALLWDTQRMDAERMDAERRTAADALPRAERSAPRVPTMVFEGASSERSSGRDAAVSRP